MLFLCVTAAMAYAQETLIPFDSTGRIERIDAELKTKLGLFPEYPSFRSAALYRFTDSTYTLEISYEDSGKVMRIHRPLSGVEAAELRQQVSSAIYERAPSILLDQSGRTSLIGGTLVLSILYHGWALPAAAEIEGAAAGGLYLITSAAGYFLPMFLTEHTSISKGSATLAMWGASRGIGHGIMLGLVEQGDDMSRGVLAQAVFTSVTEEIIGAKIAASAKLSDGDAYAVGLMGDFGSAIGLGMAHVTGCFSEDHERAIGAWVLAGSGAGLASGAVLARNNDYTRGDGYVLRGTGILGAMIPITCVDYADPENEYVYTYSAIAGTIAGLAVGHVLIQDRDFDTDDGAIINLGELAGGLFGLGLVTLASPEGESASAVYWTGATLGATGGFIAAYALRAKSAEMHGKQKIGLGLDLDMPRYSANNGLPYKMTPPPVPMASLRFHF